MKHPRQHDDAHLAWIRQLPCVVCLDNVSTEAAHVRYSEPRAAKINPGISAKPDDGWTVPLCGRCHREQHAGSEREFWKARDIDPVYVALALHRVSGDHESGLLVVANARRVTV